MLFRSVCAGFNLQAGNHQLQVPHLRPIVVKTTLLTMRSFFAAAPAQLHCCMAPLLHGSAVAEKISMHPGLKNNTLALVGAACFVHELAGLLGERPEGPQLIVSPLCLAGGLM